MENSNFDANYANYRELPDRSLTRVGHADKSEIRKFFTTDEHGWTQMEKRKAGMHGLKSSRWQADAFPGEPRDRSGHLNSFHVSGERRVAAGEPPALRFSSSLFRGRRSRQCGRPGLRKSGLLGRPRGAPGVLTRRQEQGNGRGSWRRRKWGRRTWLRDQ